jgi:FG-GAP-like repeat/PASTA domain
MQQREPNRRTLLGDVPAFFVGAGRGAQVSRRSRGRPGTVGVRASAVLLVGMGVALVLGAVSSGSVTPAGFAPARDYAIAKGPASVAIGDLNGDAKPDLVTANLYARTVSVLVNRGGKFSRKDYRAQDVRAVAIGDVNGDGKRDLASVSADASTASILINRGRGRFKPGRHYEIAGPVAVALADLNGDGKSDLVTANRTGTVSVLLNKGNGSMRHARKYRTGLEPVSLAIADPNGDGKRDIVTANVEASTVSVRLNRGDGTFGARRDYATGLHPMAVAIGDLDGDGRPDLVTANLDGDTISVLSGNGDGSFQARHDYPAGRDPRSIAIGDLNADGKADIATVNAESSTATVLFNAGDGFSAGRDYATGRRPVSIAIGDLNRDHMPDLAAAALDGSSVSVLLASTAVFCSAPNVIGKPLAAATTAIEDAHCRVGMIDHAYSETVESGSVVSENPRAGTTRAEGTTVDLVVSDGPSPDRPRGLLLWNTLGSPYEVTHSTYGPNLSFYSCRDRTIPYFSVRCSTDVRGKLAFVQGLSGGAATIGGGPYFPEARVHAAVLRASILNPEHGAVEAWYRQTKNPAPFRHDQYRIFGGCYSLVGVDEISLCSRGDSGGPRLHFALFFGEEPPPYTPAHLVEARSLSDDVEGARISALNGRWIHVAGVWDRSGIAGTRDTLRLYVNAEIVAASQDGSWGTTPCARRVSARPGGACFIDVVGCNDTCARTFAVDDLKVWDYAKTDYGGGSLR